MEEKVLLQDLAEQLAKAEGLQKNEALAFARAFFDTVIKGLDADKYVKIKGLGTFKLVEVDSRESINVNTGERFMIDGHAKISFAPDTILREMVNKPFSHFETVVLSEDVTDNELEEVDRKFEEEQSAEAELQVEEEAIVEQEQTVAETKTMVEETTVEQRQCVSVSEENTAVRDIEDEDPLLVRLAIPAMPEQIVASAQPFVPKQSAESDKPIDSELPAETKQLAAVEPVEDSVQEEESVESEVAEQAEEAEGGDVIVPGPVVPVPESKPLAEEPAVVAEQPVSQLVEQPVQSAKSKIHIILWILLCIVSLVVGFLLGHFQILPVKNNLRSTVIHDTVYRQKIVHDTIEVEKGAIEEQVSEAPKAVDKPKPTVQVASQPAVVPVQTVVGKPQVKGGAYIIVGTKDTYTLRNGETIRIIAERYYGSREMASYIVAHNNISDPNLVAVGTVLKIPELKRKSE